MAQSRVERLVNLIAYLSDARRSLTIHEIIDSIPGYPENFSSARRAFERDKEDLRSMGFEVAVEPNPSGESGYRIDKQTTYFDIELEAQERNIIDYALELYSPQEDLAKNAISKIGANNPENDLHGIRSLPLPKHLNSIFDAITMHNNLIITYKGIQRNISPKKLVAKSGFWYLQAIDLTKSAARVFRLDRIEFLEIDKNSESVQEDLNELELSFEQESENDLINVKVAKPLRERFMQTWPAKNSDKDDLIELKILNRDVFINSLFDYSGFVAIAEPEDLSNEIDEIFSNVLNSLQGEK